MQEIIIYRNPLEAALWHQILVADFIPIILGAVAGVIVVIISQRLLEKVCAWNSPILTWLPLTLGAATWILTTWWA